MKTLKSNIARNLTTLRQLNKYSQEDVAEQIGVSRQAVANGNLASLCRIL